MFLVSLFSTYHTTGIASLSHDRLPGMTDSLLALGGFTTIDVYTVVQATVRRRLPQNDKKDKVDEEREDIKRTSIVTAM